MGHSDQSQFLRYGDERIPYAVVINPRRTERVKINVHHDGKVEVEAPEDATPETIAKAVHKRARWIVSHVSDARKRFAHVLPRDYVSGEQAIYLGRRYSLKVRQVAKADRGVRLKGALLEVASNDTDKQAVRAVVRGWYKVKARDYFQQRIQVVAKSMPWPQDPPPFQLLEMKKQWGNCATGGTVTLNPFLVRAPRECIDYVITHELCHLREHNHSPEFFRLLNRAMPEWKAVKSRLDHMAELLLND